MAADGRIVDWNSEERTTSEGEAYALFFALVANDRPSFDLILNWTQNNLAKGSLQDNLPSWLWKRTAGGLGRRGQNSASDADLWIAYTLIQAGRLWQEPSYTSLGRTIAQHIADEEVVALRGNGLLLLPGRKGFQSCRRALRKSQLRAAAILGGSRHWNFPTDRGAADRKRARSGSPQVGHGFAMDWVRFKLGSGFSAVAGPSIQAPVFGEIRRHSRLSVGRNARSTRAGARSLLNDLLGDARLTWTLTTFRRSASPAMARRSEGHSPVGFSAAVIPVSLRRSTTT